MELNMFQTGFLSIMKSSTVHTAIGICHTGYAVFHPNPASKQSA